MNNTPIEITDSPSEADWKEIEDRIIQYNIQTTNNQDYRPLASFIRDDNGEIVAGITAFTWGGTLRVVDLWVHEKLRTHGYGSKLLAAAEEEARARGCKQAVLETHSFQAPEFYPGHGYKVCGTFENYPVGHRQIFFQKKLA
jgi:ribosomal protein S18 acetylase RimI-like enzyme